MQLRASVEIRLVSFRLRYRTSANLETSLVHNNSLTSSGTNRNQYCDGSPFLKRRKKSTEEPRGTEGMFDRYRRETSSGIERERQT